MAETVPPLRRIRRTSLVFVLCLLCAASLVVCLPLLSPHLVDPARTTKNRGQLVNDNVKHSKHNVENKPEKYKRDEDDLRSYGQPPDEEKYSRSPNAERGRLKRIHGKESYADGVAGRPFTHPPTTDAFVINHCKREWDKGGKKRRVKEEKNTAKNMARREWEERLKQAREWMQSARNYRLGAAQPHQVLLNLGVFIVLEDESVWEVEPKRQRATFNNWLLADVIVIKVATESTRTSGYDYLLTNMTRGLEIHVRPWVKRR